MVQKALTSKQKSELEDIISELTTITETFKEAVGNLENPHESALSGAIIRSIQETERLLELLLKLKFG